MPIYPLQSKHFIKQLLVFILILSGSLCYSQAKDSSWVSPNTVAATVKLMMMGNTYIVDGLPDDYEYQEYEDGEPNFGKAVITETLNTVSTGTGVIVTKSGLLFSNAHVTDACNIRISYFFKIY